MLQPNHADSRSKSVGNDSEDGSIRFREAVVTMSFTSKQRKGHLKKRLNADLLNAISQGDLEAVQRCLKSGASPNATCSGTRSSAAHAACLGGHADILRALLRAGAAPNARDYEEVTPLHLAAWAGSGACLRLLLHAHPPLITDAVDAPFTQPRIRDADLDNESHRHDKLKAKIPKLTIGSTALHIAAKRLHLETVKILLASNADVHCVDADGHTPLDVCGQLLVGKEKSSDACDNLLYVVQALLEAGADVNARDGAKTSALHTAAALDAAAAVTTLLSAGARASPLDATGNTPIHVAVHLKHESALKALLAQQPDLTRAVSADALDTPDKNKCTPLHVAVEKGWVQGVVMLLEAGCDVTVRAPKKATVLHLAARNGFTSVLRELLELDEISNKRDMIDARDADMCTPLFRAVSSRCVECVRLLLAAKADPKLTKQSNATILHCAVECDALNITEELLIRCPVLLEVVDNATGMRPLHLAARLGRGKHVEVIMDHKCDVASRTKNLEQTALHLAAEHGHAEVADILLSRNKLLLEQTDKQDRTALFIAAHKGNRSCLITLLKYGADLTAEAEDNHRRRKKAVEVLLENTPRPMEILHMVLDGCVSMNDCNVNDPECEIVVDYSVLIPGRHDSKQLKVLGAFMKTGQRYKQPELLLHPVIESFLYLKWFRLNFFYYFFLGIYCVFVLSFTTLSTILYYFGDTNMELPIGFNESTCRFVVFISLGLFVAQELLHVLRIPLLYVESLESWIKWGSFATAALSAAVDTNSQESDWPRHVTTFAMLLVWTELLFLLSRSPILGYYVLMFSKVAITVAKILLTFLLLFIGFSFSFMVQFKSQGVFFNNPWHSFVKVILMMTGEFDYETMFGNEAGLTIGRVLIIIFAIFITIVLMNLMVGVAVSDINELTNQGRVESLMKQVEYFSLLESIIFNERLMSCCSKSLKKFVNRGRLIDKTIQLYPGRSLTYFSKTLTDELLESLVQVAMKQKKPVDETQRLIQDALVREQEALEQLANIRDAQRAVLKMHTELSELTQELRQLISQYKKASVRDAEDNQSTES